MEEAIENISSPQCIPLYWKIFGDKGTQGYDYCFRLSQYVKIFPINGIVFFQSGTVTRPGILLYFQDLRR